jgi:hypothetical protein
MIDVHWEIYEKCVYETRYLLPDPELDSQPIIS